ncbi:MULTISPECIES: glycosyltransferase [Rhodanobacter]|uniref:glycosyltransferase n=1 Tax=Rhodanobacter TaxID=75309 RepID=UPI000260F81F|nr:MULTISPECIES: glycosyltransferase [Rhodanobacter]EIL97155.1 group 1 glycosyl transferase [Rhodanobacter thiooxydans LCS2]UJJ59249.1 glycosyltransferase [Rhodanobacter denitrificans]
MERPYGRFHFLPTLLAAHGHEVRVTLCSHRSLPSIDLKRDGVHWFSRDIHTLGLLELFAQLQQEAESFRPDWIVGCSDAWYGWLAQRLAHRAGSRLLVDAYDNFEAYMPWNLPLHWLWRRAVRSADLVTAAGPQLADRLQSYRRSGEPAAVLPMAADPEFVPLDKTACRQALGLPIQATYVGYVGSWSASRGSSLLIDAFRRARAVRPDLQLLLSGRPPREALDEPGVTATGYLPDAELPILLNALDLACVVTADTHFGRYSYPAKLCEAMACNIPVVATATGAVRWMLGEHAEHLAPLGNPKTYAERMLALLATPCTRYQRPPSWEDVAVKLENLLSSAPRH